MVVPVLSTAHVPSRLADWLLDHDYEDVAEFANGWMIKICDAIDYGDPWGAMEALKQYLKLEYPELMPDIWVRFNPDGDKYVGLVEYDW